MSFGQFIYAEAACFIVIIGVWVWSKFERPRQWYFHVHYRPGDGYVALAKRSPFVDGRPLHEPGEVFFERGQTIDEAITKLVASLKP